MTRERVAQQPPSGPLTDFPRRDVPAGSEWFREHGTQGTWWFASGPGGRFNLDEPRGSLYLASTPQAAARERIGMALATARLVPTSLVQDRSVSTLPLPMRVSVADSTSPRALLFGVVAQELCQMTPYEVPRHWATGFDSAGFDGMFGTLRFSPPKDRGLTVFGPAGTRDWARGQATSLRSVLGSMGITVLDPPPRSALIIEDL